jgi:hypothetical protein
MHKRNLSSSYCYDTGSLSSIASQATLTDTHSTHLGVSRQRTNEDTAPAMPPAVASIGSAMDSPLPFRPSLWRANTNNNITDLERGPSIKSTNYFTAERIPSSATNYRGADLTRDNSIATAISMRRADIMVSRDNPQHLHQHRMSGVRNDDEDTAILNETINNNDHPHSMTGPVIQDELLFEKKKSVIILLGRLLLKCGCPCHRVVIKCC